MVSPDAENYFLFSFYLIQNNNKLNDPWHPTWPRRLKFHPRKVYIRIFLITFGVVIRGNCFVFNIFGLYENGYFWLNCENRNLITFRELRINIFTIVLKKKYTVTEINVITALPFYYDAELIEMLIK